MLRRVVGCTALSFLILVCFSCRGTRNATGTRVYNDSVNQQFWTADWSPDDKYIAVGGVDSLLRIYHAAGLKLYKSFPIKSWIHVVEWHPGGKLLAVATLDKYVSVLNVETGEMTMLNSEGGSRAIGWNHNGQLLAVADLEGVIKIWDQQGNLLRTMPQESDPDIAGRGYLGLDWHPAENTFVAINFQINLFDTTGRALQVMTHTNKEAIMLCVEWHPSGTYFVIGDYGHNWNGENVPSLLHFWTREGRLVRSVPGSKREYRNIAWNTKGTLLATASDVLRIWSSSGTLLHESRPDRTNLLWGIDWNNSSSKIVTASRHKTVALWDSTATLTKRIDVLKDRQ
jgi:WD40 repeat protein